MSAVPDRFWEHKTLAEMTAQEWESLCDGCAKCCLHKLEDAATGEIVYTAVACRYLDAQCRCRQYPQRLQLVPDCVALSPQQVEQLQWLPSTCAYRLVAAGKPLPLWHPLLSGRSDSVHAAGISVRGRCVSEEHVHPDSFDDYIVRWVE